MEQQKTKKYVIAFLVINLFALLLSFAGKGDGVDNFFQGIGQLIGGTFIGMVAYPLVWLFNRKSSQKFEICLFLGSLISLALAFSKLG